MKVERIRMLLLSHLIFNTYVLLRLLQYSVMHAYAWMDGCLWHCGCSHAHAKG
jgi:hypothetical protein